MKHCKKLMIVTVSALSWSADASVLGVPHDEKGSHGRVVAVSFGEEAGFSVTDDKNAEHAVSPSNVKDFPVTLSLQALQAFFHAGNRIVARCIGGDTYTIEPKSGPLLGGMHSARGGGYDRVAAAAAAQEKLKTLEGNLDALRGGIRRGEVSREVGDAKQNLLSLQIEAEKLRLKQIKGEYHNPDEARSLEESIAAAQRLYDATCSRVRAAHSRSGFGGGAMGGPGMMGGGGMAPGFGPRMGGGGGFGGPGMMGGGGMGPGFGPGMGGGGFGGGGVPPAGSRVFDPSTGQWGIATGVAVGGGGTGPIYDPISGMWIG